MSKTFRLDGREIPFEAGQTIMDAVLAAGGYIPHLCHNPEFAPHGSCRVCLVAIGGRQVSACTAPASEGLEVESDSEAIQATRRAILQMLFVEGNHVCPACEKSGACQLQAVAYYTGMLAPHFTHFFPHRSVDASHPDFIIDFNRCILCELCVRASRDQDGKRVFAISGRGLDSHLAIDSPSGRLGDSSFAAGDKAAHVCPTGAILPKHRGYETPIGARLYDREPISVVGDVRAHEEEVA
ncbi:MAG: (2Fe-2S)-binding protein [Thiocapsa sp.]|jgi:[NiFe] hydrogenase diaphorase moiety small subunit|nr:2Fe-2S iron-sulfur cluster-binding protein [Thiocapsa sp.]MCG6898206.1 (2Fe-2S)-binding protein [Thiocapsa sp.]MCG6985030.1 (2Fe-2S)-binding protein [Thiocapsa sp.]